MSDNPETVISWRGIRAHSRVVASDGVEVGHVTEVAALPEEDIFHGVVFTHHILGHHILVPAVDIDRITSGPSISSRPGKPRKSTSASIRYT